MIATCTSIILIFSEKLTWNNQNTIAFPELISHAPAGGFESVVHSTYRGGQPSQVGNSMTIVVWL